MARDDDDDGGIRLDDGTWVDIAADGRWRPSAGERARAAVILCVFFVLLFGVALVASTGGSPDDDDDATGPATTTTTEATTTTTTAPPDPSSLDGEPASERCQGDDRSALPLRERDLSPVLVLNGTRRNGHAGATTDRLEALGYSSVVPDNASFREVTAVTYKLGFCAEAERMAADLGLPGATIDPVPDDLPAGSGRARLVVIAGNDSL